MTPHHTEPELRIDVDGVELRGVFTIREPYRIEIRMTHPYRNLSRSLHISGIARAYRTFDGPYGAERGEDLLREIHELARELAPRLDELREAWALAREDRETLLAPWRDTLIGERRAIGRGLEAHTLEPGDLRGWRERREALEAAIARFPRAFLQAELTSVLPWGAEGQVLDLLEARTSLFPDAPAS